jgi:hypothetical protein
MAEDPQAAPATASPAATKKQLPPINQPIASVKKGTPDEGTETIESFAKRIREKHPEKFTLNGKEMTYADIPDGKLVSDWLSKYPQYQSRLKRGEAEKASLSAYWHEAKDKLTEAGTALSKLPAAINENPFGLQSLMAKASYEFVAGPVRELMGKPQPDRSVLSTPRGLTERLEGAFDILLGGDPAAARMNLLANRGPEAAADVFAVPLVGLLMEPLIRGLPSLRSGTEAIGATPKSNAALMSLMGQALPHLAPEEMAKRTAALGEIWKQAARDLGITDSKLNPNILETIQGEKSVLPSRSLFSGNKDYLNAVTRGNQLALNLAARAVAIADRPIRALMDTFGKERIGTMGGEIADTLRRDAAATADDGVARALNKLADKADAARTVSDLNDIKQHANKEASRLYGTTTGKAINSAAQTVYAYKLAADAIRDRLYPALQQMAGGEHQGIDLIELGKRESDAIALRDGMEDIFHRLQGEQANKEALSFGQYVFGEGREHSLYSRHIYRRAAEKVRLVPGPTGIMNQMAKTATGDLGKGAVGERVMAGARRQKLLPPMGGTPAPTFEIPTGLPQEVISPVTVRESLRYEGTRDLPALDYDPYDHSTFQDSEVRGGGVGEREGSTGSQSYTPLENKARREQVGSSASAIPDRSFSGAPTRRVTQWQRIVEAEGGDVSRQGGGVLRTSDLATAQATLDRLLEYSRNHPSEQRTLAPTIENLQRQIQQARAYQGRTPPAAVQVVPGKPGVARRQRGLQRLGVAGAATAGVGANERAQRPVPLPPLQ